MHYVICYDIEDDRLRNRVAKVLEKNGCHRVQKSVFVGPHLAHRDLRALKEQLAQLWVEDSPSPADSILLWPMAKEYVSDVWLLGYDALSERLAEPPRKTLL